MWFMGRNKAVAPLTAYNQEVVILHSYKPRDGLHLER